MKDSSASKLLQDVSAVLATILPIAQLFFARLPDAVTSLFIAQSKFVGISVITLLFSYVLIVSYQVRPWFSWILPYPKRSDAYDKYLAKLSKATELTKDIGNQGEKTPNSKIKKLVALLESKPAKPPIRIDQNNIVFICIFFIVLNTLSFVWLSFYSYFTYAGWLQSINYIFIISLSAVVLTVYKKLSDNEKEWAEIRENRIQKAIDLARLSNCFANIPQVKFISAFETNSFPQRFHVWVEYERQKFEIITDSRGDELIAVYPFT